MRERKTCKCSKEGPRHSITKIAGSNSPFHGIDSSLVELCLPSQLLCMLKAVSVQSEITQTQTNTLHKK
jgi:hypothetical protein